MGHVSRLGTAHTARDLRNSSSPLSDVGAVRVSVMPLAVLTVDSERPKSQIQRAQRAKRRVHACEGCERRRRRARRRRSSMRRRPPPSGRTPPNCARLHAIYRMSSLVSGRGPGAQTYANVLVRSADSPSHPPRPTPIPIRTGAMTYALRDREVTSSCYPWPTTGSITV